MSAKLERRLKMENGIDISKYKKFLKIVIISAFPWLISGKRK